MITIRQASPADQAHLGRLGGALMRQHHAVDPRRFLQVENPEAGYGQFLVSQLADPRSSVLVAEHAGSVVGYVFATVESTNWMDLRGPCGIVQDLFVDEAARRLGAGRELMTAAIAWIRAQGRLQIMLKTMSRNENAQRLFAALGFRPTMLEMTLDHDSQQTGTPGREAT